MPINTRYFEQVPLIEESTGHVIVERRYGEGEIQYWSQQTITVLNANKQPVASVQVPFRIDVPDTCTDEQEAKAGSVIEFWRIAAFDAYEAARKAAEPAAHAMVREQLKQQEKQAKSQIVLANACPPMPVQ